MQHALEHDLAARGLSDNAEPALAHRGPNVARLTSCEQDTDGVGVAESAR